MVCVFFFCLTLLNVVGSCFFDFHSLYDNMWDDGNSLGPKEVHSYLTRVMYNRRNKFDPFWNSLVLGGVKNGQKYLGMVGINFLCLNSELKAIFFCFFLQM